MIVGCSLQHKEGENYNLTNTFMDSIEYSVHRKCISYLRCSDLCYFDGLQLDGNRLCLLPIISPALKFTDASHFIVKLSFCHFVAFPNSTLYFKDGHFNQSFLTLIFTLNFV